MIGASPGPSNEALGGNRINRVSIVSGLRIITNKRTAMRGEPWPLQPPPLCVEAADKTYGLGTSRWEAIELKRFGWEEDLLIA